MAIKNNVFVDSNFLIGLYNASDTLHGKTSAINARLASSGARLYVSNYILLEVLTVLSQRIGRAEAIAVGNNIIDGGHIEVIHINEDMHALSWNIFQLVTNKNVSFVDCSILAVMQDSGIRHLLTFDKTDFGPLRKQFGFSFF
ncbi:MAG: type II toxin-antitoxin system VapC family toxin [Candidatus Saccharimonadales bacterium]